MSCFINAKEIIIIFAVKNNWFMDKVSYWMDLAKYDMDTAEAMFATKRWLYVGFMCHQVVEKTLKAYWCKTMQCDPPYIHNLVRLINGSGLDAMMTEAQLAFVDVITPLNIEARYPEYKEALLSALTSEKCNEIIEKTKSLKQWIEMML